MATEITVMLMSAHHFPNRVTFMVWAKVDRIGLLTQPILVSETSSQVKIFVFCFISEPL